MLEQLELALVLQVLRLVAVPVSLSELSLVEAQVSALAGAVSEPESASARAGGLIEQASKIKMVRQPVALTSLVRSDPSYTD